MELIPAMNKGAWVDVLFPLQIDHEGYVACLTPEGDGVFVLWSDLKFRKDDFDGPLQATTQ